MAVVASNAQSPPAYWRVTRKDRSRPRNPYSAVPKAMATRYGSDNPSAETCEPPARARSTPAWATRKRGVQRMAGPAVKGICRVPVGGGKTFLGRAISSRGGVGSVVVARGVVAVKLEREY